jgi:hypothetical protein
MDKHMAVQANVSTESTVQPIEHITKLDLRLALAVLACATLTYFFTPYAMYKLLGVVNTAWIYWLSALLTLALSGFWLSRFRQHKLFYFIIGIVVLILIGILPLSLKRCLTASCTEFLEQTAALALIIGWINLAIISYVWILPFLIVFSLMALGWAFIYRKPDFSQGHWLRLGTLLLGIMIGGDPVISPLSSLAPSFHQRITFENHVYYVGTEFWIGLDLPPQITHILFECNASGFDCGDVAAEFEEIDRYQTRLNGGPIVHSDNEVLTLAGDNTMGIILVYRDDVEIIRYRPESVVSKYLAFMHVRYNG